jgi:hypothetical protein
MPYGEGRCRKIQTNDIYRVEGIEHVECAQSMSSVSMKICFTMHMHRAAKRSHCSLAVISSSACIAHADEVATYEAPQLLASLFSFSYSSISAALSCPSLRW